MKLVFCEDCEDIFKLSYNDKSCGCGRSSGFYHPDGLNASIRGRAIPIGFDNTSFLKAINSRTDIGLGIRFEAFVIPRHVPTIKEI